MSVDKVPFCEPWITEEDKNAVIGALDSRWLTGGPRSADFERLFAEFVGVKHAIACNSCTAALHVVMRALDIGPSDEVVLPVFTFAATANAPLFVGAKPVLADIDEHNLNLSAADLQKRITAHTKAIIPVHYAGQPCDMKEITEIAKDHNLYIVEDCAHSLGSSYMGRRTGGIGVAGCFSFYPTKGITTLEGGMITTNDDEIARKARLLTSHCMTNTASERETLGRWSYDVIDLGYNYRMTEPQAALGISQLRRVDEMNNKRVIAAHEYDRELEDIQGVHVNEIGKNRTHVYHLYVVRIVEQQYGMSRDDLFKRLCGRGIGLSVHYTPLHLLSYYRQKLGYSCGAFPVAERAYREVLSLPIFPKITKEQIHFVAESMRGFSRTSRGAGIGKQRVTPKI